MKTIPISLILPRSARLNWYQPGRTAGIDCSTFTCEVLESDLPFALTIAPINAAQGQYRIAAPSAPELALLRRGRRYGTTVVLRDAQGAVVLDAYLLHEAVR